MVIFVLWIEFDQCGVDCNIAVSWFYNMDDGGVSSNQQACILSGVAVYIVAGVCVIFKQRGCIYELAKINGRKMRPFLYF